MYLSDYQSTTNLGSGLLKVYQAVQGDAALIGIQVTNRYGSTYGLSLLNLTAPGYANPANHLVYTGDATWANRTVNTVNYFTVGPVSGSVPTLRTHSLLVHSNTPVDIYKVQLQMAGPANGEWSQMEDFYVQVLPATLPPAPAPTITAPSFVAGQFTAHVITLAGYTYFLDYKQSLDDPSWNLADQVSGDGTEQVLTDSSATEVRRFYQVRVE